MQTGGRVLLRRTAGYDLHSVREYEQGESLRKVHWRTTARRGTLMVKELEDMPHDEVAVLLDAHEQARGRRVLRRAGPCGGLDPARARAARPPLAAHDHVVSAGVEPRGVVRRRVAGRARAARDGGADRHRAGRALPRPRCARLRLRRPSSSSSRARSTPGWSDALLQRAFARRPTALVLVEAASFGPEEAAPARDPALLRLHAAGVPVATVRKGDDLAAKLSGFEEAYAAHG